MVTALLYLGFAGLGYFIGSRFRDKKDKFGWLGRLLTFIVFSLITCMGYKMGSSESVIHDIMEIGINSVILAVVPLLFTIAGLSITRRLVGYNKTGELVPKDERKLKGSSGRSSGTGKTVIPRTTFLYMGGVLMGFVFGYFMVVKNNIIDFEKGYSVVGTYITYALYMMVFLVGVDLGFDGTAPKLMKQAGLKTLIFPLVVGIATLVGVYACTFFMEYDAHESLMIGATFCWYSLAPNIIIDGGFVAAGAVAFLSNFFRVIITLITVPIVAQKVGYVETTGMAVAASMDVCIGTIESSTNKTCAIIAFVTGCVFTFLIPVTMPIIVAMNF
ncbi:MAG: lysine exporter LysO family protein [Firmicutes bacterium]|nr:lysine exporter LysO family protein [Bacillota bacterium]